MADFLKQIKETIMAALPADTQITSVEMEGPEVAIYTRNPKAFFENEGYVAKVAFDLKKRINIRTDKSLLLEEEKARAILAAPLEPVLSSEQIAEIDRIVAHAEKKILGQ